MGQHRRGGGPTTRTTAVWNILEEDASSRITDGSIHGYTWICLGHHRPRPRWRLSQLAETFLSIRDGQISAPVANKEVQGTVWISLWLARIIETVNVVLITVFPLLNLDAVIVNTREWLTILLTDYLKHVRVRVQLLISLWATYSNHVITEK